MFFQVLDQLWHIWVDCWRFFHSSIAPYKDFFIFSFSCCSGSAAIFALFALFSLLLPSSCFSSEDTPRNLWFEEWTFLPSWLRVHRCSRGLSTSSKDLPIGGGSIWCWICHPLNLWPLRIVFSVSCGKKCRKCCWSLNREESRCFCCSSEDGTTPKIRVLWECWLCRACIRSRKESWCRFSERCSDVLKS